MTDDELEAVRRQLAGLGREPLPQGVATRLDTRLAAELSSSPLSERRSRRRRVRLGASLSAVAAVAAAAVFALSMGGAGHPAPETAALRSASATSGTYATPSSVAADSKAAGVTGRPVAAKKCPPASRTGGGRPPAACPGARGGHARAV
jgi:hypothetical protein